ncbi:MAG: glycosyltransferase family 39 protein [Chloroflexi bacterium]|nr:glycosyltransferase family 39 protein [Chloroflexota bacterium]
MRGNLRVTYGMLFILLVGFSLRVIVLNQGLGLPIVRDEIAYFKLAHSLQQDLLHYTELFRPPLYPAFLAIIFRFSGDTRFAAGIAQTLLDTCNIALLFAITQRLFKKSRVSLLAAFLYAIYPEAIELTRSLFSEILFLFLSSWGIYILLDRRDPKPYFKLFAAGLCLALAALTREILAYFILLIVPLWFWLASAQRYRRAMVQTIFFLAGVAVILAPWLIRNWQIEKRFILVSTSGEYNLVNDNARIVRRILSRTPARADGKPDPSQFPHSLREVNKALKQQAPADRSRYAVQIALRSIAFDPLAWLIVKTNSVGYFASPSTTLTPFTRTPGGEGLKPIAGIYVVTLLFLATLGFFFAPGNVPKLLIAFYLAYAFGIFLLTHFLIRFRVPLMPLLMPYAAFAVLEWREWLKPSRTLYAALAVAFLFLWLAITQA